MVKSKVLVFIGFFFSGYSSLQAAGVFLREASTRTVAKLCFQTGRSFSVTSQKMKMFDEQQFKERLEKKAQAEVGLQEKLHQKLLGVRPFKMHPNGNPQTIFDPALSLPLDAQELLSGAVEKANIQEPVMVVLHNQNNMKLPYMTTGKVPGGSIITVDAFSRDLLSGKIHQKKWYQWFQQSNPVDFHHVLAFFYHELAHIHYKHHCQRRNLHRTLSLEGYARICKLQEHQADGFVAEVGGLFLAEKLQEIFRLASSFEDTTLHPSAQERIDHLTEAVKALKTKK